MLNLRQILYRAYVLSKVLRDNFTDIQNFFNDLQNQLNNLLTPPAGNEVVNARDYHAVLRDRLRSDSLGRGNILVTGGLVTQQVSPDMTVAISAGEAIVGGVACKWLAQNSSLISAPGSNTRLDYVVVNSDNSISIVSGTPSATPIFTPVSSTQLIVAALVIKSSTTILRDGIEVFIFKGGNSYYPDVYIYSDKTLSADLQYNNLIIDSVKYDTTDTYFAKCQGYAYLLNLNNANASSGTGEVSTSTATGKNSGTQYTVENYGGDVLIGTGGGFSGKAASITVYRGGAGPGGYSFQLKAFRIYAYGTNSLKGGMGGPGLTDTQAAGGGWGAGEAFVGASGGPGGFGGNLYLEAIDTVFVATASSLLSAGGDGANGNNESSGTIANLGGKGGDGGTGGNLTIKSATYINNGTVSAAGGTPGSGGIGSGGSDNNGTGTPGITTSGTLIDSEYDFTNGFYSGYAEWIRRIVA